MTELKDLSVYVACPTTRDFAVPVVRSFLETQEACFKWKLEIDFGFITGSLVHHARILAANRFLASGCNRLFWIDSDIVWEPHDFARLVVQTLKHDCVVAVYPAKREHRRYFMRFKKDAPTTEDGLFEIEGTGLGFSCMTRNLMQTLTDAAPRRKLCGVEQPCIFRCDDDGKEMRGEDYAFFADVAKHGFKIWADPSVTVGHIGPKIYRTVTTKETEQDDTSSQPPLQ